MFSATLRCGNSAYDWNTIEMRRSAGASAGDVAAVDEDPAFATACRGRRSCAASSTCRSPTGRAGRRACPESVAKLTRSTALAVPQCLLTRSRRSCIRLVSTPCRGRCSRENPRAARATPRDASTGAGRTTLRHHSTGRSHEDRARLPVAHRHPHRGAVDPGRDRLRQDARPAHRRELQGRADVAAAVVGEPRQPGARERGRELRAVRRGRAGRERRGISTSVTVACAAVYFYARLAHATCTSAAPACSRRARSCSRSPGSRSSRTRSSCWQRCDDPTSGLAGTHSVTLEKQLEQSDQGAR